MLLGLLFAKIAVETQSDIMWIFFAISVVAFIMTGIYSVSSNFCPHCGQSTNMAGPSAYCPKCGEWIPFGDNDKAPSKKKNVAEQGAPPNP